MTDAPALEVVDLVKHFPSKHGQVVHAVDGVSFTLARGEMLGLVGESGSGKSTVANCVLRLTKPTSGTITLNGVDITQLSRRAMRPLRRELHMVFQDPYSSLNPRMTCGDIVGEPVRLHGLARGRALDAQVETMFESVGLRSELRFRYPHELSGGQRQRVAIARALVNKPSLLLADEPTGNLDARAALEIMSLFRDLNRQGRTIVIVTHDMAMAEHAQRIARIEEGCIVADVAMVEAR